MRFKNNCIYRYSNVFDDEYCANPNVKYGFVKRVLITICDFFGFNLVLKKRCLDHESCSYFKMSPRPNKPPPPQDPQMPRR